MKKILVFAPHADDEVLLCAGILRQTVSEGGEAYVCLVTNGEYEGESLAGIRAGETQTALQKLGISPDHLVLLGYADTGMPYEKSFLMRLLREEGDACLPSCYGKTETWAPSGRTEFRMIRDGTHSPYTKEGVLQDFTDLIAAIQPEEIYVTAACDLHGDHAACAGFVDAALKRLADRDTRVYQFLIHTHDETVWPQRTGAVFTCPPDCEALGLDWQGRDVRPLPPGFTAADKRALIEGYRSQEPSAYGDYLLAFAKEEEIVFRVR